MVRFSLFIVICTFISVFMVDLRFQLLQKQQTWQPQKKKRDHLYAGGEVDENNNFPNMYPTSRFTYRSFLIERETLPTAEPFASES